MSSRLLVAFLLVLIGGTLSVTPAFGAAPARSGVSPSVDGSDGLPAPSFGPTPSRAAALARARALFTRSGNERRARTSGRDATLVLRDLARQAADLPTAAQRQAAARILARPTTGDDPTGGLEPTYTSPSASDCGPHICVHWVEDASPDSAKGKGNDGNLATIPAWVTTTLTTMEAVYRKEVYSLGYHAPLADGTRGGDGRIDVYLADLGGAGLYGYCTSDQPDRGTNRRVFAYCVLDNDYAASQFGTRHTRVENLEVTAAHEFFHAIQFGYDWSEDSWLMEGTAAWMEDEVYDNVNDNLQYLGESQLAYPYVSLDYSGYDYQPYGAWVFWKFLSEAAGRGRFDSPRIVRDVWTAATGAPFSTQALQQVLAARHTSFARVYGTFGTWIRDPARYFAEGRSYRSAPLAGRFILTRSHPSTGVRRTRLDHMTHAFARLSPGSTLTGAWRVRISINMVDRSRGSLARVVVHPRHGAPTAHWFPLDRSGAGTQVFDFRRSAITNLEVDLVNASTRFHCNRGTNQSCRGVSYDDNVPATINARAIR
jgi:hypothetical protein